MTAIAYRDGVIAGDSEVNYDDNIKVRSAIKIGKHDGFIFGLAGEDIPPVDKFIKWFFPADDRKRKPMGSYKFDALVVGADRKIRLYDQRGVLDEINEEFFAIGSGQQACVGAMQLGGTAEQAVDAACKWAPGVNSPVQVVKL